MERVETIGIPLEPPISTYLNNISTISQQYLNNISTISQQYLNNISTISQSLCG